MTPEQLLLSGIATLVTVATVLWQMVRAGFKSIATQNEQLKKENQDATSKLLDLAGKVGILQGQYDGLSRAVSACRVPGCAFTNRPT